MPHVEPGMVIGLFGGSFNPPHEGHLLVAEIALRRLGLHQLWWIVTPGNPLKNRTALPPLSHRLELCEALVRDPRIKVTAFEQTLGTSYTAETLAFVKRRNPQVNFVWIMGADNLKSFHRWQHWRRIATTFPIAIIDRPGATLSYLSSKMARTFSRARIDEDDAAVLWKNEPPAWTFIHGPRSSLSSTALREMTGG
ncbi:nicotinate-nucleotide adenylyltransferase [Ciceribacter thiooxidans]|uniref:Probable nicotinate-nucleotide adenylyltransferase n=1 Tax=Ciceribacter thiooxidans TaxID=1969821 RepID=A0ABV7HWT1_9HYPH|nr:nicotinate-nucleotide adenylyltransferase [Ciceribacter thiooxidans]